MNKPQHILLGFVIAVLATHHALAQSVCLPSPRLLTAMPMGGQVGTTFDVAVTGEFIEEATELVFSNPGITTKQKLDDNGKPITNAFVVSVAHDCPTGIHEARVMTRLGLSSSRVFNVSNFHEVTQAKPTTTVEQALPIQINSICNATMPVRAVNHYRFEAKKGQRIVVDCAAKGIDSQLNPVVILADAKGRDIRVQRRGGVIDFTIPNDGGYMIKVHDLTFAGSAMHFYRLALRELAADAPIERLPSTRLVSAHSWPPVGLPAKATSSESEPNNQQSESQKITLPCDISGSFYPAADVDRFEFQAKKGEVWWVEVASERLGKPTDPAAVVQMVKQDGDKEQYTDIAEFSDIASPVKVSSYGYSYDGPPYNAGSTDVMGKIEIKEDGVYRIQLSDLLGGTRKDPNNTYRLVIRKATPDFSVVMWPLHMQLRNGDRNALSKPISLRSGATMAMEVVAIRRDGFNGEIKLAMKGLPDGVTATGLSIGAGKSRGTMLVTADEGAPRGFCSSELIGIATIDGKEVTRTGNMASMAWPCRNARDEVTSPRLLVDIPVSVGGQETATLSISAKTKKVFEATEGEKLTIPLIHMRRCEFSGANLSLSTFGNGFDRNKKFDLPLKDDSSAVVLDLATLKTKPGDYTIAFYGGAVAKYKHYPEGITNAHAIRRTANAAVAETKKEFDRLTREVKMASAESKPDLQKQLVAATVAKKKADADAAAAQKKVVAATKAAVQKDIADIIVSEPISIRVLPAEKK